MNKTLAHRPFFIGKIPHRWEEFLYYHFYKPLSHRYDALFENAPLHYALGTHLELPQSRDFMYESIAFLGYFERALSTKVKSLAGLGGLMIDVGANVGYFTQIWLATNPLNTAFCFEPSPFVFPLLERNINSNQFSQRATCYQVAAGDKEGNLLFNPIHNEATGWGMLTKKETKNTFTVEVICLDSLIPENEIVDFMKIDVEGAELLVIQGCQQMLAEKRIKNIYLELNKPGARQLGLAEEGVLGLLKDYGYHLKKLNNESDQGVSDYWACL